MKINKNIINIIAVFTAMNITLAPHNYTLVDGTQTSDSEGGQSGLSDSEGEGRQPILAPRTARNFVPAMLGLMGVGVIAYFVKGKAPNSSHMMGTDPNTHPADLDTLRLLPEERKSGNSTDVPGNSTDMSISASPRALDLREWVENGGPLPTPPKHPSTLRESALRCVQIIIRSKELLRGITGKDNPSQLTQDERQNLANEAMLHIT